MLQAETLAAAVTQGLADRCADPDSSSEPVRRAASELGLEVHVIGR